MAKSKIRMVAVVMGGVLAALGCGAAFGDDDARPGATNPVPSPTRWTLSRDDEAVLFYPQTGINGVVRVAASAQNAALSDWSFHTDDSLPPGPPIDGTLFAHAVDAGRVTDPDRDQVALATFAGGDGTLEVSLLAGDGSRLDSVLLSNGYYNGACGCNHVALAVGDFVVQADEEGKYHDEIMVAWSGQVSSSQWRIAVVLLDWNLNVIARLGESHSRAAVALRLEKGDFDGDGELDAVVAGAYTDHRYSLTPYTYDAQKNTFVQGTLFGGGVGAPDAHRYWDTAAGDFDGDGKDELAMAAYRRIEFFTDSGGVLTPAGSAGFSNSLLNQTSATLVSGLFHVDPDKGFGPARRQLGFVTTEWGGSPLSLARTFVGFLLVDNGFAVSNIGNTALLGGVVPAFNADVDAARVGAVAGNFIGHMDTRRVPQMQLLVARPWQNGPGDCGGAWDCFEPNSSGQPWHVWQHTAPKTGIAAPAVATVALDADGDSYRLGPPAHIVVEDLVGLDCVLKEPPKHADFLPKDPKNWDGDWKMFNVSYYPQIHVKFEDENEQTVETSSKKTSDWDLGAEVKASVEGSESAGLPGIKVSLSQEVTATASYDYEGHREDWESGYGTRSTAVTMTTNDDDILYGTIKTLDIWRYPIIGILDDQGNQVFQEIILPGPSTKFNGGGTRHWDWYQPPHQNHNLLSYPALTSAFPEDVGEFTLPDGTKRTDLMTDRTTYDYDGNAHEIQLKWSQEAGAGSEKTWNNTVSASAEYTGTVKAQCETVKEKTSFSFSAHASYSWGGAATEKTTTSNSKGVTVDIPDIGLPDKGWSYPFMPAVYVSKNGGALKAEHAVDFNRLASVGPRWANYYGQRPDPALNLPGRIDYESPDEFTYGTAFLVEDEARMAMRGFFIRKSDPSPVSGELEELSGPPRDGDVVQLAARVYNFALVRDTGPFTVRFDAALVDTASGLELDGSRRVIGTAGMASLPPLGMREATLLLDTTGMSHTVNPATGEADALLSYRFYVVVDPDNRVPNEIHEWMDTGEGGPARDGDGPRPDVAGWTDADGRLFHGNNEGYWPPSGGVFVDPPAPKADQPPLDAWLHGKSLAVETEDGLLDSGDIRIYQGQRYRIRAHVRATAPADDHRLMLFHAGHPDVTDEVFSVTTVRGLREDTYVWTAWKPAAPGEYEIWASFREHGHDIIRGNARDGLKLTVLPAEKPRGCGCQKAGPAGPVTLAGMGLDGGHLFAVCALLALILARRMGGGATVR